MKYWSTHKVYEHELENVLNQLAKAEEEEIFSIHKLGTDIVDDIFMVITFREEG